MLSYGRILNSLFIELLEGLEEAATAILNVFYHQVEDAENESQSSSQSEDSSSESEAPVCT